MRKLQLEWAKQQYGEDAAWKMYELQYTTEATNAQNQAQVNAYTGATSTSGGGGTASGPAHLKQYANSISRRRPSILGASLLSEIVRRESSYNPMLKIQQVQRMDMLNF
jgi:hypothetical protein